MRNKKYRVSYSQMNIIGIRNNNQKSGSFDDILYTFNWNAVENKEEELKEYIVTVDPGDLSLLQPINSAGCAIVKPGQYIDMWAFGYHHGDKDHPALVQVNQCTVYRDNNKNNILEFNGKEDTGLFGINCHRASRWKILNNVGLYSAGCIVHQDINRYYSEFIPSIKKYGNNNKKFNYTLLTENDFK
jgi:hypothetical protein